MAPKPQLWEVSSIRLGTVEKPTAQVSKTHGPAVYAALFGRSTGRKYMFFLYRLEAEFSYGHAPIAL